ncbi:NUDIX domain-containing protein [bacterium]|nr:NUDIX domain-containing protein [bacterium]
MTIPDTIDHDPDEQVDRLDPSGKVIGIATRHTCHGNPELIHGAVHIFVYDDQERLFLQKRSQTKFIQPGKWDTSVGGHLARGENPEQAARREMLEELGIPVIPLIFLHRYLWQTSVETELVTTYRCFFQGPFQLNETEIEQGRFFSDGELRVLKESGLMTPNLVHELSLLKVF